MLCFVTLMHSKTKTTTTDDRRQATKKKTDKIKIQTKTDKHTQTIYIYNNDRHEFTRTDRQSNTNTHSNKLTYFDKQE